MIFGKLDARLKLQSGAAASRCHRLGAREKQTRDPSPPVRRINRKLPNVAAIGIEPHKDAADQYVFISRRDQRFLARFDGEV